jgi:hypothetical protein
VSVDGRAPVEPTAVDIPLGDVPSSVSVDATDATLALAEFDRSLPEYAGVLDATPEEG